jgi:flagellin
MSYRINSNWVKNQKKVMEKLSSGHRINRASDDCAGLSVSEKLRTQVNGYKQALQNTLDGISLLQTSDGIAEAIHSMMQRIRTLVVQACNEVYGDESRSAIQKEIDQIKEAIKGITDNVVFNTMPLLKNDEDPNQENIYFQLHIGANEGDTFKLTLINAKKIATDYLDSVDVTTYENSERSLPKLDKAINKLSEGRAILGAQQNRLERHIQVIQVARTSDAHSETIIRDANMAYEMMKLTRNQILIQSGSNMYLQANINYRNVVEILPT